MRSIFSWSIGALFIALSNHDSSGECSQKQDDQYDQDCNEQAIGYVMSAKQIRWRRLSSLPVQLVTFGFLVYVPHKGIPYTVRFSTENCLDVRLRFEHTCKSAISGRDFPLPKLNVEGSILFTRFI